MKLYLSILFVLVISFTAIKSCKEEHIFTEVEEITNIPQIMDGFEHFVTWNSCYISPDIGFASITLMDVNTKEREFFICKTSDGGRSWSNYHQFQSLNPISKIQNIGDTIYAYYANYDVSKPYTGDESSVIISSTDMGETWNPIYIHQGVITDLVVFDHKTMVIALQTLNDSDDVDFTTSYRYVNMLHVTRNGGRSWSKLEGAPAVKLPVYKTGSKVCFASVRSDEILTYDIYSRMLTMRHFDTLVHAFNISNNMLSMAWHGGDISLWDIKEDGEFECFENIKWGPWRLGSYHSKFLARDGDCIFSYIGRFSGENGINRALLFSDNKGRDWQELKVFDRDGKRPLSESFSSFHNDTLFQISYMVNDTTKIFRVNK